MIEIRVEMRMVVRDDLVDEAVQFVRHQAHNAVSGFHASFTPHELEITTQDRADTRVPRPTADDQPD